MFLPTVFSRFTPRNMPTPIIADTALYTPVDWCSESRTYTAISGPKQPSTNMPAASDRMTNNTPA